MPEARSIVGAVMHHPALSSAMPWSAPSVRRRLAPTTGLVLLLHALLVGQSASVLLLLLQVDLRGP